MYTITSDCTHEIVPRTVYIMAYYQTIIIVELCINQIKGRVSSDTVHTVHWAIEIYWISIPYTKLRPFQATVTVPTPSSCRLGCTVPWGHILKDQQRERGCQHNAHVSLYLLRMWTVPRLRPPARSSKRGKAFLLSSASLRSSSPVWAGEEPPQLSSCPFLSSCS